MELSHEPERFIDVDMDTMELETPAECGALTDCQLRVYLDKHEHRGQFHLVAHRASDNSQKKRGQRHFSNINKSVSDPVFLTKVSLTPFSADPVFSKFFELTSL